MVSSGTITGFRAISPSGETLIDYSGVSFPAIDLLTAYWSTVGLNSTTAGNAINFSNVILAEQDVVTGSSAGDLIDLDHVAATLRSFVRTNDGNDIVNAGGGNDTVIAGHGEDTVNGGIGDDIIYGDHFEIPRSNSSSALTNTSRTGENDILNGGAGNDIVYGRGGNDIIDGGSGDDQLFGEFGSDTFIFSEGNDTINGGVTGVSESGTTDEVNFNQALSDFASVSYEVLTLQPEIGQPYESAVFTFVKNEDDGSSSTSVLTEIERFNFITDDGSQTVLTSDELVQYIDDLSTPPEPTSNVLIGTNGADVLQNAAGTQYVDGLDGIDTFQFNQDSTGFGINQTLDGQGIVVWNGDDFDILNNIERVVFNDLAYLISENGSITIETEVEPPISGGDGDVLQGGSGDDRFLNTAGTQYVVGDEGNDTFIFNSQRDDYDWSVTLDGNGVAIWNDEDFDILYDVETIQFLDETVTITDDFYL
jgi:Ca2+-binding RTX toxin-like protein